LVYETLLLTFLLSLGSRTNSNKIRRRTATSKELLYDRSMHDELNNMQPIDQTKGAYFLFILVA
jgi:hypothetical protein